MSASGERGPCIVCMSTSEACVESVMNTDRPCCKDCAHDVAVLSDFGRQLHPED